MIDIESIIKESFTKRFLIEKIEKKIENGEDLTNEEKDNYLQFLYQKATEAIKDSKKSENGLGKGGKFILKFVSITGKIFGGEIKQNTDALDTAYSSLKTNKKNNFELLRGITITSYNMTLENFQVLREHTNEVDIYFEAFENYLEKYLERTKSYKRDFSNLGKEEVETMTSSRAKIKALSKKYKTNLSNYDESVKKSV